MFLLAPGPRPDLGRVGITVSRKIGIAVVRNRAKRLVRESLRRLPEFVPPGVDMVVVVRTPPNDLRLEQLLSELQTVAHLVDRKSRSVLAQAGNMRGGLP